MMQRGQNLNRIVKALLIPLAMATCFLMPASAYAVDGYESMGFRTLNESLRPYTEFFGHHEASDGSAAYCLNIDKPSPTDLGATAFTTYDQGWSWAENIMNVIAWNGYPNTRTISGTTFNDSSARAVTQLAVWMATGRVSDSGIGDEGSDFRGGREENEIVRAAAALKNGAASGALKAPRYARKYYGIMRNGQRTQDMLWVPVSVDVNFSKTSADASVTAGNNQYAYAGAAYDIYQTSNNAKVASITTDAAGRATCGLKPGIAYYAVETKAPAGFELNADRIPFAAVSGGQVNLADRPGRFSLTVQKTDSATGGAAQAGASLEGAEFRLMSASTLGFTRTAATDRNGSLTFTDIPLGTVNVVETKAPLGYKLDPTVHTYTVTADDFARGTISITPEGDFSENVIAFDIEITKFKDDGAQEGSTLETPAEGVAFDIISNTTNQTVGRITTDRDGHASTAGKWFGAGTRPAGVNGALPYDRAGYRVHEVKETVPEGYEQIADWTIDAEQITDGVTLSYIARNSVLSSRLQIVKTDALTEQTVPLAGFTFQIIDRDGNAVTQENWYPTHETLDRFTTDESGTVSLPQRLPAGTYTLREIDAQPPYLLAQDRSFTIGGSSGHDAPLVTLRVEDAQAYGRAEIAKHCTLDNKPLKDAGFDVVAQEAITSPDGSIRTASGEVVGHVKTNAQGTATIDGLPLGMGTARYAFIETKAPTGHVLDATPIPFEVSYQDAHTAVVTASVEASDAPTTVEVRKTVVETDETLAGAKFELWNAADEIDNTEDDGKETETGAAHEPALKDDAEVKTFTTDKQGLIRIHHLAAGTYRLREIEAPTGFVIDSQVITIVVEDDGTVDGQNVHVADVENDFTKVDISKRDITNEEELPGAELTLTDSEGNVIEQWTSGEEPHRIERLAPGEYTLSERRTPQSHDLAEDVTFTVEETGEVQAVAMYDTPIEIKGQIDKRQQIANPIAPNTEANGDGRNRAEVTASDTGTYAYSLDFRSTSNTWTDEFTVEDQLTGAVDGLAELEGVVTPVATGDYDGKLNVWYKTKPVGDAEAATANATLSDGHENPWLAHESTQATLGEDGRAVSYEGWRLWQEGVSTEQSVNLEVADLGLESERIVGIRFEYGRVDAGFTTRKDNWDRDNLKHEHDDITDVNPDAEDGYSPAIIRMRVTDAYTEGYILENAARVDLHRNGGGEHLEDHDEDRVVQTPKATPQLLPKTGTGLITATLVGGAVITAMLNRALGKRRRTQMPTRRLRSSMRHHAAYLHRRTRR